MASRACQEDGEAKVAGPLAGGAAALLVQGAAKTGISVVTRLGWIERAAHDSRREESLKPRCKLRSLGAGIRSRLSRMV
jgi:hypothetical protein